MGNNNVHFDAKNYLDIQGLGNLKGQSKTDPKVARHEVAQQFESMLIQMLIKSMRDANKAFTQSNEFGSNQEMYQDLFDKQVALSISAKGFGLGQAIERYLGQTDKDSTVQNKEVFALPVNGIVNQSAIESNHKVDQSPHVINASVSSVKATTKSADFKTEFDFVKGLWGEAKKAASVLGLDPKILLAQAVLETGWGKRVMTQENNDSSHNLFNIKADSSWDKANVQVDTLEERDGVVQKERGSFRVYDNYAESFSDYVRFIQSNPRYQEALKHTNNPEAYMQKLQEANYATDSRYSQKVLDIYNGERFNSLVNLVQT